MTLFSSALKVVGASVILALQIGCSGSPTSNVPGPVSLTVVAPAQIHSGEPTSVTLQLRNTLSRDIEFSHGGDSDRIYFNIVVRRTGGEVVWSRVPGQNMLAVAHTRTLRANEEIKLSDTWNGADSLGRIAVPGDYILQAIVYSHPTSLIVESPLRVLP